MAYERKFKIGKPILEVNNISLSFGGVKAITDTSFNVLEHEVRAIIGPNGAGKSSMLNCINGIYKPQQGTVSFKGKEIPNITPKCWLIYSVNQMSTPPSITTVWENAESWSSCFP